MIPAIPEDSPAYDNGLATLPRLPAARPGVTLAGGEADLRHLAAAGIAAVARRAYPRSGPATLLASAERPGYGGNAWLVPWHEVVQDVQAIAHDAAVVPAILRSRGHAVGPEWHALAQAAAEWLTVAEAV